MGGPLSRAPGTRNNAWAAFPASRDWHQQPSHGLGILAVAATTIADTNRRLLPRRLHRGAILAHGFTDFLVDLIRAGLATGQGAVPPGRRTVNTEPLPGSLVTVTSPPIMRASLREMARPSPVPP